MRNLLLIVFFILTAFSAFSQTNSKIKDLERKRKLAIQEIENTTLLLKEAKKSTTSLMNRISLISQQINSRQKLIELLNLEIAAITELQAVTETEIQQMEVDLKQEQRAYAKAVEGILLKKQGTNKLLFVLSGKSVGESVRRMKYLKDYSEWRTQQITNIKEKQRELQEKKITLEKTKTEKLSLLDSRQKEQVNLKEEEKTHKHEVEEANKKQVELQDIIAVKQRQADQLNSQIERLIAEEVARQERAAKRRASREKNTGTRRKRTGTTRSSTKEKSKTTSKENRSVELEDAPVVSRESLKLSSNFAANKGKLPMPVTGRYRIVGRFGVHQHNKWVATNSSGIDIHAQTGSQARSVFDGEVSRVMAFPGYNNCIIIRHGGYYTFYGNIRQVSVKQGQRVSAGQSLGTIYSDSGGAQLHFQLWKGTTKLNPEPWLRK